MIVACLKWVTHPGEPNDERFAGLSPADQSALEFALTQAQSLGDVATAITVGPPAAVRVLRDALACGVGHAIHVVTAGSPASDDVAGAIARAVPDARWVWCGDYSLDRGTGSVPAYIAAHLHAQQALGAIAVRWQGNDVTATRRLDGGRREVLAVSAPAVISVEGATAHLRRAGLGSLRTATVATIEVVQSAASSNVDEVIVRPYRPRARTLAQPVGTTSLERVRALTAAGAASMARIDAVSLEPAAAAARIVSALRQWGYLGDG